MKHVWLIGLSALASMVIGGCSSSSEAGGIEQMPTATEHEQDMNALVVDEQTETRTSGRIHTANGDLTFVSELVGEALSLRVVVNGKGFDVSLDGEITIVDGHNVVLSASDKALLRTFSDAMLVRFGEAMATRNSSVYRLAVHLSNAPANYVHARIDTTPVPQVQALQASNPYVDAGRQPGAWDAGDAAIADTGLPPITTNTEGKSCRKKGSIAYAVYNNTSGVLYVEPVLVGSNWGKLSNGSSYDCMGKCGAACGIGGGYTKDCLDHDTCSYRYAASGGASDKNCGDEYTNATDDILNSCSTN